MTSQSITPQTVVSRIDVMSRRLDLETVMMDVEKDAYYGLNETGTWIWELLTEPMSVASVRDRLAAEFEVTPQKCERDVIAFVQSLVSRGLVEVRPDAEP